VFEYYKGNELKMRTQQDFERSDNLTFTKKEFAAINKHARANGSYSVLPTTKQVNPDGE